MGFRAILRRAIPFIPLSKVERSRVSDVTNALNGEAPGRFCASCRHIDARGKKELRFALCSHPSSVDDRAGAFEHSKEVEIEHLITGKPLPAPDRVGHYCSVSREFTHLCGKDGRWWEPKP